MNPATDMTNHQEMLLQLQPVAAIDFKDLRVKDIILIQTQNTHYSFEITSAIGMQGNLSSDSPDDFFPDAVLFGSLVNQEEDQKFISGLEPQSQALFLVQQGNQLLKVITSAIIGLCCVRSAA